MNNSEVIKKLGISQSELTKRCAQLGIKTDDYSEDHLERIKNFGNKLAIASKPEPEPERKSNSNPDLKQVLSETKQALKASREGKTHLSNEFLEQQEQTGTAIGKIGSLMKARAIATTSLETDEQIYRLLIEGEQDRVAELAGAVFGGDAIPKLYHQATSIQALPFDLEIDFD